MTAQGNFNQTRRHRGALVVSAPPNLNMKQYKSVILSIFQNVKSICANVKPPIESFMATVLIQNLTSFRVTVSLLF